MTREEAIDRVLDVTWPRWREWQPAAKGGWLLQLRRKRAERIVDALLGQPDPEVEITDEMVTTACVVFFRENRHDPELSLHEQSQKAMRAALRAVLSEQFRDV